MSSARILSVVQVGAPMSKAAFYVMYASGCRRTYVFSRLPQNVRDVVFFPSSQVVRGDTVYYSNLPRSSARQEDIDAFEKTYGGL